VIVHWNGEARLNRCLSVLGELSKGTRLSQ